MVTCAVPGCDSSKQKRSPDYSFHQFPLDPVARERWMRVLNRPNWTPHKYSTICSKHFDAQCFVFSTEPKRRKLRIGSIPTICMPAVDKLKEDIITIVCPNCKSPVIHEDGIPNLIAKVYHYLDEEYEALKKTYVDLSFPTLANVLRRAALATGVTEEKVLAILQKEKGSKTVGQPRVKKPRQETQMENIREQAADTERGSVVVKIEPQDMDCDPLVSRLSIELVRVKQEPCDEEELNDLVDQAAETERGCVVVEIEPQDMDCDPLVRRLSTETVDVKQEPCDEEELNSASRLPTQEVAIKQEHHDEEDDKTDSKAAQRQYSKLYRDRHRELINQRRRETRSKEKEHLRLLRMQINEGKAKKSINIEEQIRKNKQRQQRYYERHREEINRRKRDKRRRVGSSTPAATAAERNRKYRERRKQEINERRRVSRLRQKIEQQTNRQDTQGESTSAFPSSDADDTSDQISKDIQSNLLGDSVVKVEKIDINDDGFS